MGLRPSIDEYFLMIAAITSSRATCTRRAVGAVAVDENGFLLSTGYNGLPKGMEHCTKNPCKGANFSSGQGLEQCNSIHAEINAIAHCSNPQKIHTMYLTCSPCVHCMKAIIATGCRRIVAMEIYSGEALNLLYGVEGTFVEISFNQLKNKFN